jgi:hypothetical protein
MASIKNTHFNGYEEDLELWGIVRNGLIQLDFFTTEEEAEEEAEYHRMKPEWLNNMNPYRPIVFKVGKD